MLTPASRTLSKVVHFVGGDIVGAVVPRFHEHSLQRLASSGVVVIATPYRLS